MSRAMVSVFKFMGTNADLLACVNAMVALDDDIPPANRIFRDSETAVPPDVTTFYLGGYFEVFHVYDAVSDVLIKVTAGLPQLNVVWYLWTIDDSMWSERNEIRNGELVARNTWHGELDDVKQEALYQAEINPSPKKLKRQLRKLVGSVVESINNDVLCDPESFAANTPSFCLSILDIVAAHESVDFGECLVPLAEPLKGVLEMQDLHRYIDDRKPIGELYAKVEAAVIAAATKTDEPATETSSDAKDWM